MAFLCVTANATFGRVFYLVALEIGFALTSRVAFTQQPFPCCSTLVMRERVCVPKCVSFGDPFPGGPWRTLLLKGSSSDRVWGRKWCLARVLPKEDVELQMSKETAPFSEPERHPQEKKETWGRRDALYSHASLESWPGAVGAGLF